MPARRALVAASLVAALVPGTRPALADWLVTRDGQLIETVGPWRIEGRQVVFESRSLPVSGAISSEGTRFTIAVDRIDLSRSVAETEARGGRRREVLPDLPAVPRTLLQSWEGWGHPGHPPDRIELVLRMGGAAWDNFLQVSERHPKQEVAAGIAEARLTWRLLGGLKTYMETGHIHYDAVPSTTAYGAGLRFDASRHGFQVGARLEPNRRAPELNDTGDVSDLRWYRARYFGRGGTFDWSLSGERLEQRFEEVPFQEIKGYGLRATLVHRALGGKLVPEAGFGWSRDDSTIDSEDDRQRLLQLGLRARPVRPLTLAVRFDHLQRRYVIENTRSRNFGRKDTRQRWVLEAEIKLTRQLALALLYSLTESDSTRADRDFTARNASAGLTVTLGSTRRALPKRPGSQPATRP